jgi:hypothetical protein
MLVVTGENGYVASCNLSTGVWCNYKGKVIAPDPNNESLGSLIPGVYNDGKSMGADKELADPYDSAIYCMALYNQFIIFAGANGRVCSCKTSVVSNSSSNTIYTYAASVWYPFDYSNPGQNQGVSNDGSIMGNKSILTMLNYSDKLLFLAGTNGYVATFDFQKGVFTPYNSTTGICNNGSAINISDDEKNSIYASIIINDIYVVAGTNGRVASYSIIGKKEWIPFNDPDPCQVYGMASKGDSINYKNINAIESHNTHLIFGGDDGLVSSYDLFTRRWTPYNASNGIRNDGEFIKSSISTILKNNLIFYFTGKAGNTIYKYRAGDIIYDETGKPKIEKPSEQQGIIKALPVYDRIYSVKSSFFNIIKSYNIMINDVDELSQKFPQGCSLIAGIKNTSGKSSTFKFIDTKDKEEKYLDSLNLAISLGVKFDDNVSDDDKKYLVNEIIIEIPKYINEIQSITNDTIIRLNFNTMLDVLKTKVPNIEYFELYTINNYDANSCQTIFWKKDILDSSVLDEEYLSIRNDVDEINSDIPNQEVVFKPAIEITLL